MWKRDDAAKPNAPAGPGPAPAHHGTVPPAAEATPVKSASAGEPQRGQEKTAVNIGKSVVIKGAHGIEDLTIEGRSKERLNCAERPDLRADARSRRSVRQA